MLHLPHAMRFAFFPVWMYWPEPFWFQLATCDLFYLFEPKNFAEEILSH